MKTLPYWWEDAEPEHGERQFDSSNCAVLIVGSGYTGLSAAITLAEAGVTNVFVIDGMRIGEGASSRNGGQIGNAPKFTLAQAVARFGEIRGKEIMDDYRGSLDFMLKRASTLKDPFDLNICGNVTAAHNRKDMEALRKKFSGSTSGTGNEVELVEESEMYRVLKTDIYRGAIVKHREGTIHPAKYVRALANRARELGVRIFTGWRFEGTRRGTSGHVALLRSVDDGAQAEIQADKVLLGVNGYAGPELPWLRQRTIPVQSYMIATEELPFDQLEELIPNNRAVSDTKKILYYYRRSPDGRRILFGGRARFRQSTEKESAVGLRRFMEHTFPELRGVRITHSWHGNVCFAFDFCSHGGRMDDGVYFASCCNGGGISNQTHMGHRIAEHMLEVAGSERGIIGSRFPRMYFYKGHPWFLPAVGSWYRFLDRKSKWFEGRPSLASG